MKNILTILLTVVLLAVTACGDDDGFVIKCDIKGLDTHGLEMAYMTRGGIARGSFHPVDGKVELKGASAQPTLVEVFTLDGKLLFSCVAQDGDKIKVNMTLDDPTSLTMTGQDASRDYSAFVAEHDSILRAGSDAEVNRMIAEAVRANPSSMASTLLLVTRFRTAGYELLADSLLSEISPDARPALLAGSYASLVGEQVSTSARGDVKSFSFHFGLDSLGHDTIVRFTPSLHSYTLLAFTDTRKPDSITRRMRGLRKTYSMRRLKVIEVSLAADSTLWRTSVKGDSMNWFQAWAPGGPSAREIRRLSVPGTPYYIVADSQGRQVYRGASLYRADTLIRGRLVVPQATDSVKTL